ncbi:MAG: DUF2796 domain-containing protein [Gammaproteobacteria bacterium]|nr:DUF2796 domain-containing protein [Gammaproteobacteria bacterium]
MIFRFYPRNMIKHGTLIASLLTMTLLAVIEKVESATILDTHEHGSAKLNIAADGNVIFIEFESPAANIVGFEQTPQTTDQTHRVDAAKSLLENLKSVFRLSDSAACRLDTAAVKWVDGTGGHTEFQAEYQLICERIEGLETIDVLLFNSFPDIEYIYVQAIFPARQIATELSPGEHTIELK